jgi:hypothetical protein
VEMGASHQEPSSWKVSLLQQPCNKNLWTIVMVNPARESDKDLNKVLVPSPLNLWEVTRMLAKKRGGCY